MTKSDYAAYVVSDLLVGLDGVTARAMFGEYALYLDGSIFALVCDDILYFKADNQLKYGKIQEAVETARRSGVRVMAAITEPKSTAPIFGEKPDQDKKAGN